jgi:hypothetical protein
LPVIAGRNIPAVVLLRRSFIIQPDEIAKINFVSLNRVANTFMGISLVLVTDGHIVFGWSALWVYPQHTDFFFYRECKLITFQEL